MRVVEERGRIRRRAVRRAQAVSPSLSHMQAKNERRQRRRTPAGAGVAALVQGPGDSHPATLHRGARHPAAVHDVSVRGGPQAPLPAVCGDRLVRVGAGR